MAAAVEPIKPPPLVWPRTVAYAASVPDLESLELSLRRDEGNWASADISALTTAKDDNVDVTAVTYKESDPFTKRGKILLATYSTDAEMGTIKGDQKTAGATFLFAGTAYVATKPVK